jgi:hypothetical protein
VGEITSARPRSCRRSNRDASSQSCRSRGKGQIVGAAPPQFYIKAEARTQEEIGAMLGVGQDMISDWLRENNMGNHKAFIDNRVKVRSPID